ncbi:Gfo/Idh/MocA family oxidoreductase, partial [Candidatus Poribacteria bacterium]|nr:Gfo/Idh/MocA family oxidoreductase [Candidatus Poribacteria bacterium]
SDAATVVAIADPDAEGRAAAATLLAVPADGSYENCEDMLAGVDLDAVCIATPHHLHRQHAVAAASAGVDIISEKPMSATLEEADAIIAAVRAAGVRYTVVHNLLWSNAMREGIRLARGEQFGDVTWGRAQSVFRKAEGLDARDWRATRSAGGGCAIDTAYHEIYCVEALVGSPVARVEGRVRTVKFDIDVDDLALMLLEHEDGSVSTVTSTWCAPSFGTEAGRWCEVHGTRSSVRVYHRDSDPLHVATAAGGWQATPLASADDPMGHIAFFGAAFAALRSGDALPVTMSDARRNLAIIEAAREATAARKAVEVGK